MTFVYTIGLFMGGVDCEGVTLEIGSELVYTAVSCLIKSSILKLFQYVNN